MFVRRSFLSVAAAVLWAVPALSQEEPSLHGWGAPPYWTPPAAEGPGCPFAGMIGGTAADAPAAVAWTVDAAGRLDRIPAFIRPMARQAIERFARERGYATVTDEVMDQARDLMGM